MLARMLCQLLPVRPLGSQVLSVFVGVFLFYILLYILVTINTNCEINFKFVIQTCPYRIAMYVEGSGSLQDCSQMLLLTSS